MPLSTPNTRNKYFFEALKKYTYFDTKLLCMPLPTHLSPTDKNDHIELEDPRTAIFKGINCTEPAIIRANKFIPASCAIFYFEVTIVGHVPEGCNMSVGVCTKSVACNALLGSEKGGYGYQSMEGHKLNANTCSSADPYGPSYSKGDTIGCCLNMVNRTISFTKNGLNLGVAFRNVNDYNLYPAICLSGLNDHVKVNFGDECFEYNFEKSVQECKELVKDWIEEFELPMEMASKVDQSMKYLVISYLISDGYYETALKLAQEMGDPSILEQNKRFDTTCMRKDIKMLILKGDLESALKELTKNFPSFHTSNRYVIFLIKCQGFIEMIKSNKDLKSIIDYGKAELSQYLSSYPPDTRQSSASFHSINDPCNGYNDTNDDDNDDTDLNLGDTSASTVDMNLHGPNDCENEFYDHELRQVFSLIAYTNPTNSPVAYLLQDKRRNSLANLVNDAILEYCNQECHSELEKIIAQIRTVQNTLVAHSVGMMNIISHKDFVQ